MTRIPTDMRERVIKRAQNCCEYCRIHEDDHFLTHEIDHIIAEKHRGETDDTNLCLSCFDCNRNKGSDIGSIDPQTNTYTPLFNPRTMNWDDHFKLEDEFIVPLTAQGRVTALVLKLNNGKRLIRRRGLIELDRYPCTLVDLDETQPNQPRVRT